MINRYHSFVVLGFLVTPEVGLAHSPIKGIDSFYNGLLHPLFVPAHLLLLVAFGLLFGQQGPKDNQGAFVVFLAAMVAGLIAAWLSVGVELDVYLLTGAAAIGLLVAFRPALGLYWCSLIAALSGFLLGMDSAQESLFGKEKFVTLLGSGIGIILLFLYPMALADYFNKKTWQKIGVRIIGSWVTASSLMVLALSLSRALKQPPLSG